MDSEAIRERLRSGNEVWRRQEGEQAALRRETAENGQKPWAIVIACSDSRVIPEQIFSAGLGELFVIRVAGNVLDRHQLGSIEYAAAHLHCHTVLLLGHTRCGAVSAALSGGGDGFIQYITGLRDECAARSGTAAAGIRRPSGDRRGSIDSLRRGLRCGYRCSALAG